MGGVYFGVNRNLYCSFCFYCYVCGFDIFVYDVFFCVLCYVIWIFYGIFFRVVCDYDDIFVYVYDFGMVFGFVDVFVWEVFFCFYICSYGFWNIIVDFIKIKNIV